ncbi:hypothetical protein ACJMK2_042034 [Sinanodonta woodiana]|uniref:G-protein coupled receptors family 1 profile domain-containing protein n=1 Tax=Sinanodonta woodiana TaxID=1069815 RepID=A0ABD3W6S0_SINWO
MTNFFLANLAVADFCVGTFCILPSLSFTLSQKWILGQVMCKLYSFVWNLSYTASIIILTVIAVERYIAITHPLRARHFLTRTKLKAVQAIIWIVSATYNTPYLFVFDIFSYNGVNFYCYPSSMEIIKGLTLSNIIMWYLIPLVVMAFIYFRIASTLWRTTAMESIRMKRRPEFNVDEEHRTEAANVLAINQVSYKCDERNNSYAHISHERSSGENKARYSNMDDYNYSSESCSVRCDQLTICQGRRSSNRRCRSSGNCMNITQPAIISETPNSSDLCVESSRTELCGRHNNDDICRVRSRCRRTYLSSSKRVTRARRSVIRLLIVVVCSFAICVLPHHIRLLFVYWNIDVLPANAMIILSPVSFIILFLNSGLNPILYALLSKNFRRSFFESCLFKSSCRCKTTPRKIDSRPFH